MAFRQSDERLHAKLRDVRILWYDTERKIKEAELAHGAIPSSAINELRYAGGRILEAYNYSYDESSDEAYDNLIVAEAYVTNARIDVDDALVLFVTQRIDELNQQYGAEQLRKASPRFDELVNRLELARALIANTRAEKSFRSNRYPEMEANIPRIIDIFNEITFSSIRKSAALTEARSQALLTIVASAGALMAFLATVSLLSTKFDFWHFLFNRGP